MFYNWSPDIIHSFCSVVALDNLCFCTLWGFCAAVLWAQADMITPIGGIRHALGSYEVGWMMPDFIQFGRELTGRHLNVGSEGLPWGEGKYCSKSMLGKWFLIHWKRWSWVLHLLVGQLKFFVKIHWHIRHELSWQTSVVDVLLVFIRGLYLYFTIKWERTIHFF